ncbi:hypothetical protein DFH11DRAFT_883990 [Phellopilus nigrolimitatus]|nr:hypothetical protein DFH11DRAFT_883990 [Phellopilus nigrolimitatus]
MAGANYMGGRRNAARARTKDVTGRVQKGHFMKQRHQILVRGLQEDFRDDTDKHSTQPGHKEEISLAHAKKDLQVGVDAKTRNTNPSTSHRTLNSFLQSSSSPGQYSRARRSKILETLDINEPTALRATMNRLLRLPDLAGLSQINAQSTPLKRNHYLKPIVVTPRKKMKTSWRDSDINSPVSNANESRLNLYSNKQHDQLPRPSDSSDSSSPLSKSLVHNPYIVSHDLNARNNHSDSSVDRFSTIQEPGTDYYDSGFSELEFVDEPEVDKLHDMSPTIWNSDVAPDPAGASSSTCFFSRDYNEVRKLIQKAPSPSSSLPLPRWEVLPIHRQPSFLHPGEPNSFKDEYVSLLDFDDPWLALDDILGLRPSMKLQDDGDDPLEGIDANNRFGLGYKPAESRSQLDPLQGISQPSFHDASESPNKNVHRSSESDIEIDNTSAEESIGDSGRFGLLDSNHSPLPPTHFSCHPQFQTPPRRFNFPPASTRPLTRPRFSLKVHDTVSSILKANREPETASSEVPSDSSVPLRSPLFGSSSHSTSSILSSGSRYSPVITSQRSSATFSHFRPLPVTNISPSSSSQPIQEPSVSSTVYQMLLPDVASTPSPTNLAFIDHASRQNTPVLQDVVKSLTPSESFTIDGPDLFGGEDTDDE